MKKVLITREEQQFNEIKDIFIVNGLEPISFPVIKFSELDFQFNENEFDYVIFTSPNGVKFFLRKYRLSRPKIIAVGIKTKSYLKRYGYNHVMFPEKFSSEGILEYIVKNLDNFRDKRLALVRAFDGVDTLLKEKPENVYIDLIPVYKTEFNVPDNTDLVYKMLENKEIHSVVFSSPSTVYGFFSIFSNSKELLAYTKVISIGKTTSSALKERGIENFIIPPTPTFESITKLIKEI